MLFYRLLLNEILLLNTLKSKEFRITLSDLKLKIDAVINFTRIFFLFKSDYTWFACYRSDRIFLLNGNLSCCAFCKNSEVVS
jgi:hypothetical protein